MARPRGYIEDYNRREKTRELLAQVEHVLDTYRDELPLTARQIFYRLIGSVDYPNDENAYNRLQEHLRNFRRAGLVEFDHIRDDGTTTLAPLEFASPEKSLRKPSASPPRGRVCGSRDSRAGLSCGARRPAWRRSSTAR